MAGREMMLREKMISSREDIKPVDREAGRRERELTKYRPHLANPLPTFPSSTSSSSLRNPPLLLRYRRQNSCLPSPSSSSNSSDSTREEVARREVARSRIGRACTRVLDLEEEEEE